jgi:hypothetical protein
MTMLFFFKSILKKYLPENINHCESPGLVGRLPNSIYSADEAIIYLCNINVKLFLANQIDRKEWTGIVCLLLSLSVCKV